ncbi:MAG: T9SS type A sorting domain-containing protein [Bacteroidota bacterium]
MKHILLTISIISTIGLSAQITLQSSDYFPVVGDTLRTATDTAPMGIAITGPGGDQQWNFASLQAGFSLERIVEDAANGDAAGDYPNANILFEQVEGGEGYYQSNGSTFSIIGFAGSDPLGQGVEVNAPFNPPYVERWAPLNFFDQNFNESALTVAIAADDIPGNIFEDLPITPDSIRVRVATDRTDLVDAWGTVTIPDGTYDVLREKRTEFREVRLDAKIGVLPWADITDLALEFLPIDDLGADTLVTYTFWSNSAKEAIAVINSDPTGTEVESVTFKSDDMISSVQTPTTIKPQLYIYPNPAIIHTRLEFANMPADQYSLEIYDVAGRSVLNKSLYINEYHLETLNVVRFRKGVYLAVLRNGKGEKLAVRRLLVTTP